MNCYTLFVRWRLESLAIEQEVSKKVEYNRNHIEPHEELTARERDVLQLIAKGYENHRIADELLSLSQDSQDPSYPIF